MNLNLNYLFGYCTFVQAENSLNAQPSPMRKRKLQVRRIRHLKFLMSIDKSFLEIRKIVRTQGKYVMQKLFDDYLTGLITKKRIPSCFLCGSEKNITKEHILPRWVFESNDKHFFTSDVNQLNQSYIRATIPACLFCNSLLLNNVEKYIQKTLSEVNLKTRYYSEDEWENVMPNSSNLQLTSRALRRWEIRIPVCPNRQPNVE